MEWMKDASEVLGNLALLAGAVGGGWFAWHEHRKRRAFSAILEVRADAKFIDIGDSTALSVALEIRNIGASRTTPRAIRLRVFSLAVVNGKFETTPLHDTALAVSHDGITPNNMFVDSGEAIFRSESIAVPREVRAVKVEVLVNYDAEYRSYRDFVFSR
ncbi:hypothetical protein [Chiayiivirga flava]|uniref:Uncharacterized protein n=1 Tax=Chiayiivirga flava TaxID=659595 RepID=A0A7W8D4X2_9GAMM|nr:hypothetical protein [Chiayiivirga flava]MBB5206865.1 hypothetical protein [Chiayiivirga flava]